MQITCAMSQVVPYVDGSGARKQCVLRPGKHRYPMLNPKNDPILADVLRVLRKHSKISFDDLLPSDINVLKSVPPGVDKVEYLAEKVLLSKNPKGRGPSNIAKAVKRASLSHAVGHRAKDITPESTQDHKSHSAKHRKISDKSEDSGS